MIEFSRRNFRSWSLMGINPSIWSIGFSEVAAKKEDVAVFTADLARYSGLDRTFKNYPDRCYNVGIAEQNMVSIAAGMAMEGTQTWMTTYAPFMSFRCADQFRHLMGNLNLNMKAIGSAAGFSAGLSGSSLLAINDIAFARSIPNMIVLTPADCTEAIKMVLAMAENKKPTYMRFCGTVRLPTVYQADYEYKIGKAVVLTEGKKVALVACGTSIVAETQKASTLIKEKAGFIPTVVNMHTIKPIDSECIKELALTHEIIATIEEHNVIGGLGSAVSEVLTMNGNKVKQLFLGIEDRNYVMGSRTFMLEQCGLSAEKIVDKVISYL